MKWYKKMKNKLGVLALFALMFQLVLPIYETYVYAEENEPETEQMAEEPNNEKPEEMKNDEEVEEDKEELEEEIVEEDEEIEETETEDPGKEEAETKNSEKENLEPELEEKQDQSEQKAGEEENKENPKVDTKEELEEEKKEPANLSDVDLKAEENGSFLLELGSVTDLEGNSFSNDHLLHPKDEFKLKLDWQLEDKHGYKKDDVVQFDLPKGLKFEEEISFELKDRAGLTVANAVVKPSGKVEMTFTDFVENHSDVTGYMEIISKIDEDNAEVENDEIILQPIGDEGIIKIPVDLGDRKKTIDKKGTPNKGYNADEIHWEVTINKMKNNLKNAAVTDELPEGTEYKEGSLKVTKLNVGLSGNILGDLEEVEVTGVSVAENKLDIPLGDIKDAYRIEYTTKVTDDEQKKFKNNAILSDDDLDDISANKTITIDRGEPIKKSAVTEYNPKTGIIEWELEFNFNQKNLDNITLKDAWTPTGKMDLVEESLAFQEVSINEEGKSTNVGDPIPLPEGASLVNGEDQFEVQGISTGKAYKVTYQTKVKDRVLEGFKISNTAGFGTDFDGEGTGVGAYYGSKSAGKIDYSAKTIKWTVELNHDEYPMKNISVLDTLGDGLTLNKETIKIKVGGLEYKGDYTLTGENPFKLTFPDDFTTDKKIVITYKTTFVADEVTDNVATNKADLTWTPGGGGDSITKDVEAKTPLNEETGKNHWKNGQYDPDSKEITWTIYANYRENQIDNLIIKDEPQGNQNIVEGSAVVTELEILSNGKTKDTKTLDDNVSTIDTKNNSLIVNVVDTDKAYRIQYRTSLKGIDDIKSEYTNQAEIFDGGTFLSKIEAKVGIKKTNTYGEKAGIQDGKIMNWSITVNPGQQKINNLTLFDEVSSNQEILTDTIKVYKAKVDTNGNATKGEEFKEVSISGESSKSEFEINWNNEIDRAFVVEYSTLFFAAHKDEISNTYHVTGNKGGDKIDQDDTKNYNIKQLGSGGASGTAGYLIVDKVDTTYNQEVKKMEGITFELIDSESKNKNMIKTGTTDENGQIDFGRLLYGEYELREVNVPDDYVTKEDNLSITIDKKYDAADETTKYRHTVENYEPVFAIELIKTGTDKEVLSGAEFTLFNAEDEELAQIETNEDGKISFDDLEKAGTYYVKETKAPKGYVLNNKKHKVTVGEKQQKPTEIKIENKARGAVRLTKTDKDTADALAGVEFVLQKKNASGEYETLDTFTTDGKGQITTSNTLEAGNYQFVEVKGLSNYRTNGNPVKFVVNVNSTKTQELTMKNEQHKGSIKLIKKDAATKDRLEGAEFKLVDSSGNTIKTGLTTNNEGEMYVGEFFLGQYQLIETKAPTGYELDEIPIDIEITEDEQVVEKTMTNNRLMDISVKKEWNSGGEKTEAVTVELLPINEKVTLSSDNDWTADFTNLRVYDDAGDKIDYEVVEQTVDGYKTTITGDETSGYTIINTKLMNLSGTKTWMDDNDPQRPDSITVQLVANGNVVPGRTADANKENSWIYTFEDLPMYDADGKEITYDIEELEIEGYQVEKDGYDLTNTRANKISVKGEKTWKDEDARDRPDSIEVALTRKVGDEKDTNFSKNKTVTPNKQGKWVYEFEDLEEFNEQGVRYTYYIKEEKVSDKYKSLVNRHNITNVRVGETELSGKKRWKDDTVDDRPEFIEVDLLRNDVLLETQKVRATDNWEYTFKELDKYDEDGKYYKYEVKEKQVLGYKPEVDGNNITNTRSEKTSIKITKGWLDDNSEERPGSVIVFVNRGLEADNLTRHDTVKVKSEEDWTLTIDNLEAYNEDGLPYIYELEEKAIEGYESTVNGFNITNLRVGETEVTGEKKWEEVDNQYRPEQITVNLLANDEIKDSVTISESENWKYDFGKLPQYDKEGKEIKYEVKEAEVPAGYTSTVTGMNIINKQIETEVTGEKIWLDDLDEHPEITLHLLANGDKTDKSLKVSAATNWEYRFTEIPKYNQVGEEIEYTVKEETIDGYETTIEDFIVTNLRIGETEVNGEKIWKDAGPKDRPESIDVILTRNVKGELDTEFEKQLTVRPDSEEQWHYTFTDLPEFNEKGIAYTYTVEEKTEPIGYESSVDGHNIINLRVGTVNLSGTKTWQDDNREDRPDSITVNLLRNQKYYGEKEITEAGDWSYTFTDLPEFDEEGIAYDYQVSEVDVPGYAAEFDGMNITNTRSEKKSIEITKGWLDDDSTDRPKSIKVDVYQNDELYKTLEVKASEDWVYELEDLEAYDAEGQAYTYSIEEQKIDGYETTINGFNLTNTRVGTLAVEGEKFWKDAGPKDRPESIDVTLTRELKGEVDDAFIITQTVTPDSTGKWLYMFDELPAYDEQGIAYDYQVKEDDVPKGYETTIDGYDITNLRVGTTEVNILKNWKNDQKENRPKSIAVDLLQNGKVFKSVTLSAVGGWKYTFTDLPAFDQEGKAYKYTIQEKAVDGYETNLEETEAGFELTNTYLTVETPTDSEEPDKSDKPTDPELPRTGEVSSFAFYLIGGLLIIGGLVIGKKRTEG